MTTTTFELSLPVVLSLFSDLLGKAVTGSETDPVEHPDDRAEVRAVYLANDDRPGALYFMNLELAAAAAAALVMMPVGLVGQSVQDGTLHPALAENSFEVFNVISRLISRAGGERYTLRDQVLPGDALPEDATDLRRSASRRIDLSLRVEGYGSGVLSIFVR